MTIFDSVAKSWSKEILYALNERPMRFRELLLFLTPGKPRVSTRTLSERLKEMEEHGLVLREVYKTRPPKTVYQLTDKGRKALAAVRSLEEMR